MQKTAMQILIASVVFFLLMLGFEVLVRGAALTGALAMSTVFITLIFAMFYAAIQVALVMFRGNDK